MHLCPYTIGKSNKVYCEDGVIGNFRCPYWQQDGNYTFIENILTSNMYVDPRVLEFSEKLKDRFEVVGYYRWFCTQWPSIRSKVFEYVIQDFVGKKYTIEEALSMVNFNDDELEDVESLDVPGELYG